MNFFRYRINSQTGCAVGLGIVSALLILATDPWERLPTLERAARREAS